MFSPIWSRKHRKPAPARRRRLTLELLENRCLLSAGYRSINGTGNNLLNPTWGAAGTDLLRRAPVAYGDGISSLGGTNRPSPRYISNVIAAQGSASILNDRFMSDWVWQWGQFIDHDLDLTPTDPTTFANVPVPQGDPFFDPFGTGNQVIGFNRSVYDPATGTDLSNPRQQPNVITAYIDGSQVYGSDARRADALRTHVGGLLKTSPGDMLPLNNATYFTTPLPNANNGPFPDGQMYVAGDVRANEQVGLTAVHTLFMREHNRIAGQLARVHPDWSDEQLYQEARRRVGAEIEAITYNEFLPALLGPYAPGLFGQYDPSINASVTTEFSTAAFRVGHTLLSPQILRIESNGTPDPRGPMALKDSFFNPPLITNSTDLGEILKGLASQRAQEIDNLLVDGVRNFLFGPPGAGGFDLASLNIQRGRDHGLADYNTVRATYGLPKVTSFAEITTNANLQGKLQQLYGSVDNIDLWVGALAEDHLDGSSVGPTITAILVDEFTRARDGDRFFFTHDPAFSPEQITALSQSTLAEVIQHNTGITQLQAEVFIALDFGAPGADGNGASLDTGAAPDLPGSAPNTSATAVASDLARNAAPIRSGLPFAISRPDGQDTAGSAVAVASSTIASGAALPSGATAATGVLLSGAGQDGEWLPTPLYVSLGEL
jgi:hypothetical protein